MRATFTVFRLAATRKVSELTSIIGETFPGTINCDRAKMYLRVEKLPWCRAHEQASGKPGAKIRSSVELHGKELNFPCRLTRATFSTHPLKNDGEVTPGSERWFPNTARVLPTPTLGRKRRFIIETHRLIGMPPLAQALACET